jgi:type VI secretion system protein ImpH
MKYGHFARYLPTGDMLRPTYALVRYMAGVEHEFDIGLCLRREEVPPCVLGWETPASPRLGWSTWIKAPGVVATDDPSVTFQEDSL